MNTNQMLGVTAAILGAALLGFSYNAFEAPIDQVTSTLSDRFTSEAIWYLTLGVGAVVGGGALAFSGE